MCIFFIQSALGYFIAALATLGGGGVPGRTGQVLPGAGPYGGEVFNTYFYMKLW